MSREGKDKCREHERKSEGQAEKETEKKRGKLFEYVSKFRKKIFLFFISMYITQAQVPDPETYRIFFC